MSHKPSFALINYIIDVFCEYDVVWITYSKDGLVQLQYAFYLNQIDKYIQTYTLYLEELVFKFKRKILEVRGSNPGPGSNFYLEFIHFISEKLWNKK